MSRQTLGTWVKTFLQGGFHALSEAAFHEVINDLVSALAHDQLVNYYQPQMDLASREIVGFEALVRWPHPQLGVLTPGHFLNAAERSGLISSMTERILKQAIAQAARWREKGLPARVSVNVSGDDFTSLANLSQIIQEELARWNLPGEILTLEVTERKAISEIQKVSAVIDDLKSNGTRLSIDDFGTGYATLEELIHLHADEIKIDRQFVHGVSRDDRRAALFRVGRDLARELGAQIVAEGVEDSRDLAFVQEAGCDLVQGYLVSPPLPAKEIPDVLTLWEKRSQQIFSRAPFRSLSPDRETQAERRMTWSAPDSRRPPTHAGKERF